MLWCTVDTYIKIYPHGDTAADYSIILPILGGWSGYRVSLGIGRVLSRLREETQEI